MRPRQINCRVHHRLLLPVGWEEEAARVDAGLRKGWEDGQARKRVCRSRPSERNQTFYAAEAFFADLAGATF